MLSPNRTWLIAAREFKTYTTTISFWVALALGPIIMSSVALLGPALQPPAPAVIEVRSEEAGLAAAAAAALSEAGELTGRPQTIVQEPPAAEPDTRLVVRRTPAGGISAEVEGKPLTSAARALLARDLAAAGAEAPLPAVTLPDEAPPTPSARPRGAPPGRLAVAFLLWTNLIGAMGMLMQSVTRERASRALETLLAAARPMEIMLGKLAGVGAVSLLVVGLWLAAGGLLAWGGGGAGGALLRVLFQDLANPWSLLGFAGIYLATYVAYGSALLGIGALARDDVSAQNLSRPLYAVVILVFFALLADLQAKAPAWLLWAPPFTPFIVLVRPWLGIGEILGPALLFLAAAGLSAFAAAWAIRAERLTRGTAPRPPVEP